MITLWHCEYKKLPLSISRKLLGIEFHLNIYNGPVLFAVISLKIKCLAYKINDGLNNQILDFSITKIFTYVLMCVEMAVKNM